MQLKKEIDKIERFSKFLFVLFEEGLDVLIYELELHTYIPIFYRIKKKLRAKAKRELEQSVRNSLQRMGGLFVKAGQFLSTRPELVGKQFARILSTLQDNQEPFHTEKAKEIVEQELGKPLDQVFKSFSEPVRAASFSQVHKAVLLTGEEVAVKVQRPRLKEQIDTDIKILKWLVKRIRKKRHALKDIPFDQIFTEIKDYTKEELNYLQELDNLTLLHDTLKEEPSIVVPKPYPEFSTSKVLVMEWQKGDRIQTFAGTPKGKKLQTVGIDAMLKQYFEYGVFQADPHPGNFLVQKNTLVMLDVGVVGQFTKVERKQVLSLFINCFLAHPPVITQDLMRLHTGKNKINKEKLEKKVEEYVAKLEVKDYTLAKLLNDLILSALEHKVKFSKDVFLFVKSVMTAEQLAFMLSPSFSFAKVEPVIQSIARKQLSTRALVRLGIDKYEKSIEEGAIKILRGAKKRLKRAIGV